MKILIADYTNPKHASDIVGLLDEYSRDPMGRGKPLSKYAHGSLIDKLSKIKNSFSVMCYVDSRPAGLITCFENFSTFQCKPLINIHDIVVSKEFRQRGVSQAMLLKVQEEAQKKGCCKITLEVLEGNEPAKKSYSKFGFKGYELDPKMGRALFWEKEL